MPGQVPTAEGAARACMHHPAMRRQAAYGRGMAYDGKENPPGYYNTVARPNPGGTMAEPMGPRGRLVTKVVGAAFVLAAVASLSVQAVGLVGEPSAPGVATSFVMGRYVALVMLPLFFGGLGVALLRHADDKTVPYLRPQRRSQHRRG